jgi:hypothetical protein
MRPKDFTIKGVLVNHTHKWYYEVDADRWGYGCCFCDAFINMYLLRDYENVGDWVLDGGQKICDRVWDSIVKGEH